MTPPADPPGAGVAAWDERHARRGAPGTPHAVVDAVTAGLVPGRAVDLACGAGRHALLLAGRGWAVDAVDTSAEGLAVGGRAAGGDRVRWHRADAVTWLRALAPGSADLVLVAFAMLPGVVTAAAGALAGGGHLLVVGHAAEDAGRPGTPRDVRLLHDVASLADEARGAGLAVVRADVVGRGAGEERRHDAVLLARRPTPGPGAGPGAEGGAGQSSAEGTSAGS